ncbi:MAG TPA: tripartite tricarboxylate transporter TctB family protein [Methylomirabilota bacterium]|nr:tripartite tricarboxylate transporter TctB family protein [Methylomirabilota bacterium]
MGSRRAWQIASVAFLALFGFVLIESRALSLQDSLGPGPGFFPFWLSLAGTGLAAALLVQARRGRPDKPVEPLVPRADAGRRVLAVLAGLAGVTVLFDPLGFRLTIAAFAAFLLTALGVRRWWVTALFALAGSFGVFHVFYHWLKVPLPVGVLGL